MSQQIEKHYGPIAFIDIAGFANLIENFPLDDIINEYARVITSASFTQEVLEDDFDLMVFSDTLTIRLVNQTEEGFVKFIKAIQLISHRYFYFPTLCEEIQLPLRGAITIGEYCWINGNISTQVYNRKPIIAEKVNFILGKAIVDAHKFEGAQDWFCISMSNKAFDEICRIYPMAIAALLDEGYLLPYEIPLKENKSDYGIVINPSIRSNYDGSFNMYLDQCFDIIHGNHDQVPLPVKLKYYNTLKFLKWIHENDKMIPLLKTIDHTIPTINASKYNELLEYFIDLQE